MFLSSILKSVSKKYSKVKIEGISFDTRQLKKKDIFFAINGNQTSGSNFIKEAEFKGASAIAGSLTNLIDTLLKGDAVDNTWATLSGLADAMDNDSNLSGDFNKLLQKKISIPQNQNLNFE